MILKLTTQFGSGADMCAMFYFCKMEAIHAGVMFS